MIVDAIEKYLGGTLVMADDKALDAALRSFRVSLVRNLTQTDHENRKGLRASSPWYCGRRIIYEMQDEKRADLAPRSRLAFLMGDTVEAFGIFLTRLAGVPILSPGLDGKQEAHEVDIGEARIVGHIDMTVWDSSGAVIPVDWKSMADYGFKEFEAAIRDPSAKWWTENRWGYLTQLRIYMIAKAAPYGVFVGVNKNTGHMAEMHVPPDPEWAVEMETRATRMARLIAAGAAPDSIPRPPWATTKILPGANQRADGSKGPVEEIVNWRCDYCPFWQSCYPGFDLLPLKSGPVRRRAIEPTAETNGAKVGAA